MKHIELFLENIYKLCQKQFTVNVRKDLEDGFVQCNFTYPPSDRVSEERRKRRLKESEEKHVLDGELDEDGTSHGSASDVCISATLSSSMLDQLGLG